MDFTIKKYSSLLHSLLEGKYEYYTYGDYVKYSIINHQSPCIILRHDVDRLPHNSLRLAELENALGIKGSYYFRVVPGSYDIDIMNKIAELGHEIGYHYEDVDLIIRKSKLKIKNERDIDLLIDMSYESFSTNLAMLRRNFDIKTICMHGSPQSQYDNKIIWLKYDYKNLGLTGEPYLDIDWDEWGYLTDTGRRWNGSNVSIRDKVGNNHRDLESLSIEKSSSQYPDMKYYYQRGITNSKEKEVINNQMAGHINKFKKTSNIIHGLNELPDKIMFTIHPQRWADNSILWAKELIGQNAKNIIKKYIIKSAIVNNNALYYNARNAYQN